MGQNHSTMDGVLQAGRWYHNKSVFWLPQESQYNAKTGAGYWR